MKKNVSAAQGAQAKVVVLTGNGVSNKKEEVKLPLMVLPSAPTEEAKQEAKQESLQVLNNERQMSIDALMDKADRGYLLRQKYQEIREKRRLLDSFAISHDKDNAQLTLIDAKGLTISTSNPVTIGKLLTDWMNDLNNHLKRTEGEIRAELERHN